MKITLFPVQKTIVFTGDTNDERLFKIISVFGGDAVKYPVVTKSRFPSLMKSSVRKLVIDASHESITKEFIQLIMRMFK